MARGSRSRAPATVALVPPGLLHWITLPLLLRLARIVDLEAQP
jgi:hypothetical protein